MQRDSDHREIRPDDPARNVNTNIRFHHSAAVPLQRCTSDDAWDSGRSVTYAVGTDTLLAHRSHAVKSFPCRRGASNPAPVRVRPGHVLECTSLQVACAVRAHQL
jgi:hypothetical protein